VIQGGACAGAVVCAGVLPDAGSDCCERLGFRVACFRLPLDNLIAIATVPGGCHYFARSESGSRSRRFPDGNKERATPNLRWGQLLNRHAHVLQEVPG